jgi:enoyl-CoA hydratase/carnithine racemase
MSYKTLIWEESDDAIRLTLNRPDAGNRIDVTLVEELTKALVRAEDESRAKVLILAGLPGLFCKGIDLTDFPAGEKPDVYGFGRWEKVVRALERLNKFTICVIDGECIGGGMHLPLACDVRLASDRAVFQLNESRLGFLPGMAVFRLAKFIGLGRARRMAATGRRVGATEAHWFGLVDSLAKPENLDALIAETVSEFDGASLESATLIRRLQDESYASEYEEFIGGFLAAQHRAIQTEHFTDQVKKAHQRKKDGDE